MGPRTKDAASLLGLDPAKAVAVSSGGRPKMSTQRLTSWPANIVCAIALVACGSSDEPGGPKGAAGSGGMLGDAGGAPGTSGNAGLGGSNGGTAQAGTSGGGQAGSGMNCG